MAKSVNGGPAAAGGGGGCTDDADNDSTTPICRCRVLYLGSAVPHITKDGLQGIQEPLRDLYPEQGVFWNTDRDHAATGIDSWLSVWSNGILVENVDDKGNTVRRFHPIESLHYCAAVRYVSVPSATGDPSKPPSESKIAKFLPLDSPFSKSTALDPLKAPHPPLFACILRRTSGIKVLECHAFICKKEAAANALVRCCFHAYADTMHAKQIELESPYEQLDKRRSRSIGSALDSQSLIEDKVNNWQKNSTGGSSSGGSPDEVNGFGESRSFSRPKQPRTPSVASLISHSMAEPPPPPHTTHGHHGHHGPPMLHPPTMEPIYYNGMGPTGTLRSVRSFISLAALKSHKKRPRQIPMPLAAAPPPPPPVMFATLTKKELKKVLKKESTLKRKHKYKDFPVPFLAPNGYPIIYGPPMPPPMAPMPAMAPMPIYAHPMHGPPLPPPGPFYGTIDSRKGRLPLPPPPPPPPSHMMAPENGHLGPPPPPPPPSHFEEPIYVTRVPSPNGTLRPITPHGEPIYLEGRSNGPMPMPMPPGPAPMFVPHPQMPGTMIPCTMVPTLSRKELKELEKQQALMKKAAKKEKKKLKNGKQPQMINGGNGNGGISPNEETDFYQPRQPYGYPPDEMVDQDESLMTPSEMQLSSGNYSNASTAGGIYKKKGHLNERAFSYSIRQEHRSRSNSLSNLAFENGGPPPPPPPSNGGLAPSRNTENGSHHNSSISLKSTDTKQQMLNNGNGGMPYEQQHAAMNGNGRIANGGMIDGPIDPNMLATRMSNLKLNGYGGPPPPPSQQYQPPPPPPPLPPNGYHIYYQRTATIKRL